MALSPGSWAAIHSFDHYYRIRSAAGRELGHIHGGDNANLVAAAPDLMEALEGLITSPLDAFQVAEAKKALEKAKGRP